MRVEEWLGEDNVIGQDIWHKKYQYNNETFDEWLDRVSGGDSNVKRIIVEKKFLFGGRILANRGTQKDGRKISMSNCYVLTPPEDNIESIFKCASQMAKTYSRGGGCGVDIGKLAPKGAKIHNAANETSGAVSFMDLYSMVTGLIGQAGRRGALMISIPCNHPDLEDFIEIKQNNDRVTKANISIRVTDEFMNAVNKREKYTLSFTRKETGETTEKEVDAYELFKKLCKSNWDWGEPGILYWDTLSHYNLLSEDKSFDYGGVNPCAEEPLPPAGSCNLGSINLAKFVTANKSFDFPAFKETVAIAVRALNDILDEGLPLHPLKEQRDSVRDWRQIGLGIFGLADMLIKMEIRYGSEESLSICDKIGYAMASTAIEASSNLAKEYGSYPKYNADAISKSGYFINNTEYFSPVKISEILDTGLRNSQLLTIAPTGTLSTMLQVSGGIEPIFANYYTRKTGSLHGHDAYYKIYTPIVKEYMDSHGIDDDENLPHFFVTAQELDFAGRIKMQSTWQLHIDASISSTINLPNSATVNDVENIYMNAWIAGLKGVTIFRDGCKRVGILTTDKEDKEIREELATNLSIDELPRGAIIVADDCSVGKKRTLHTGCGTLHCEAFFDPDTGCLLETYFSKGSSGGCQNFMVGLSRLISLAARGGISIHSIVDQLQSSGTCPSYAVRTALHHDTSKGSCCPVAIGNALIDMYQEMQSDICEMGEEQQSTSKPERIELKCPQCGGKLVFEGGCNTCKDCGWSKCD